MVLGQRMKFSDIGAFIRRLPKSKSSRAGYEFGALVTLTSKSRFRVTGTLCHNQPGCAVTRRPGARAGGGSHDLRGAAWPIYCSSQMKSANSARNMAFRWPRAARQRPAWWSGRSGCRTSVRSITNSTGACSSTKDARICPTWTWRCHHCTRRLSRRSSARAASKGCRRMRQASFLTCVRSVWCACQHGSAASGPRGRQCARHGRAAREHRRASGPTAVQSRCDRERHDARARVRHRRCRCRRRAVQHAGSCRGSARAPAAPVWRSPVRLYLLLLRSGCARLATRAVGHCSATPCRGCRGARTGCNARPPDVDREQHSICCLVDRC
jgi:hypothetical protein